MLHKTPPTEMFSRVRSQLSKEEEAKIGPILDNYKSVLLRPSQMNIDWEYQERPRTLLKKQIATQFKKGLCHEFMVTQHPDGSYWVVDGATRKLGMEEGGRGEQDSPCRLFQTPGKQIDVLLFKHFNKNRMKVPVGNQVVIEGVAEQDKGLYDTIKDMGFSPLSGSSFLHLKGISKHREAYNICQDSYKKSMFTLKGEWGQKYGRWDGEIVKGLTLLYKSQLRSVDGLVRPWMKKHGPDDIQAEMYKVLGVPKKLQPNEYPPLVAMGVAAAINRRRKGNRIDIDALRRELARHGRKN